MYNDARMLGAVVGAIVALVIVIIIRKFILNKEMTTQGNRRSRSAAKRTNTRFLL